MKRAKIKDVARESGFSITTVSHALNGYDDVNEETKRKIQEVAKRLEYIPDAAGRALGGKAKKCIAFMVVGGMGPVDANNFVYGILSGIYNVTERENYDFAIMAQSLDRMNEITFTQACKEKNVSGVVIYGMRSDAPYYKQLVKSEIPVVLVDDLSLEAPNICAVSIDNERAARELVSHMIENGYRNIAMIAGGDYSDVYRRRITGYMNALQQYGLDFYQDRVLHAEFHIKPVMGKVRQLLLEDPEIDAIFCANDTVAIEVINGLREMSIRVPEDIGIAGFDGMPLAELYHGGITTVKQDTYQTGLRGAEILVEMIEGNKASNWVELPYQLVKRKSTQK